jgi:hypothetical protein
MQLIDRRRLLPALILAAVVLFGRSAVAVEYDVFVDVDSQDELFDLLEQQEIDQDAFDQLTELLRLGLDLNAATRDELYGLPNLTYAEVDAILDYRKQAGFIKDPADLVAAGAITSEELYAIAPFVKVASRTPGNYAVDGFVRAPLLLLVPPDDGAPPSALEARVSTFKDFTAGVVAVMTHTEIGNVSYDPGRNALTADGPATRVRVPKLYVKYDSGNVTAILGSYRVGFGQRLVFDDTARQSPNGAEIDDDLLRSSGLVSACRESTGELGEPPCDSNVYTAPDLRWRQGMFGGAVDLRGLRLGPGELELHAFGSSEKRPIYQYEIYDKSICANPEADDDPSCAAPAVYKLQDDPSAATSKFKFATLPGLFRENTVGGNVSYFTGPRTHVGVTGYVSSIDFDVDGMDLDFQEYSRYPRGGAFGALGLDAHYRLKAVDVGLEAARSFDGTPSDQGGGGGNAAILTGTYTFDKNQVLEASARYYGTGYANPYARPIAAADEYDGLRARDEAGVRLKYVGAFNKRLQLRATADYWQSVSDQTPKLLLFGRFDWLISSQIGIGWWTQFEDKDLSRNAGQEACYEIPTEVDIEGEPVTCSGLKLQNSLRLHVLPSRSLNISTQITHAWLDDANVRFDDNDNKRQDLSAWMTVTWRIAPDLRLRGRLRYLDQGAADDDYLETSVWGYAELTWTMPKEWRLRARYDIYKYLDDRSSTSLRDPNPQQWVWLEAMYQF